MTAISGTLPKSCCSLPPVQAEYEPKGTYTQVAGLKSYTVGPEDAKQALLLVYDIFGFKPQILQGADLLASQGFRVVMPDFLVEKWATPDMFTGTEEGNKKRAEFFSGFPGAISSQAAPFGKALKELKGKHEKVGALGYCWGYKVIVTGEGADQVDAIAGAHPSFAADDDADKITQPLALLPSQGEDMKVMQAIFDAVEKKNPGKNFIKHYDQVPHGYLAARADLKNEPGLSAYQDGYNTLSAFFKQNL